MFKRAITGIAACVAAVLMTAATAAAATVTPMVELDFTTGYDEGTSITSIGGYVVQVANGAGITAVKDPKTGEGLVARLNGITGGVTSYDSGIIKTNVSVAGRNIFEFEFLIDEADDVSKCIKFGNINMAEVKGNTISFAGQGATEIELNTWYQVYIICNVDKSTLTAYLDGNKIGDFNISMGSQNQTRIQIENRGNTGGSWYLKNVKHSTVEGVTTASVKKAVLDANDEDVEVTFDFPVSADTAVRENITITAKAGGVPEYTVTQVQNDSNLVTGLIISFAEELSADNEFTVSFAGVIDMAGNEVTNTVSFVSTPPDFEYLWGDIKLYKGIGSAKEELSKLESGFISIDIPVTNNGIRAREVTLAVAVYEGDTMKGFHFVSYELGAEETAQLSTGMILDQVTASTRVDVMLWRTPDDAEPLLDTVTFTR